MGFKWLKEKIIIIIMIEIWQIKKSINVNPSNQHMYQNITKDGMKKIVKNI